MKKFLSLVLALVMALSLTTVAWGADVATVDGTGYADLQTAVNAADGKTVVMQENVNMPGNAALQIPEGANVTIDMNGKTLTSMDGGSPNWMAIKINRGATLTLTGNGKIVASCYGVYVNPGATFNLESGSIEVSGNGTYDLAVVVWNGTFNMSGGSLKGQEGVHTSNYWADNGETGIPTSTVSITGGSIEATGANPVTIATEGAYDITISGGTFSDDVSAYVAPGYSLDTTTGAVATKAAGGAADSTLYFWDNASAKWLVDFVATGKTLDDLKQDASDKCLPCYLIDGEYFVEVPESAATFKLVYGNAKVFLTSVPAKVVKYVDTASVLTVVDEDDAECGDWFVTNLDEDDVYYISYNKKGTDVDGVWVKAKNGSEQILVNGKIVDVELLTIGTDIEFMAHTWKGNDVVNYQYTTVKCSECGKVAKLYANATAATVGKKEPVKVVVDGTTLGWITLADAMDFGANAPVVTDKVQSAETFDAGIAMYVGMSVMAAAGSAVVIGKKKD